jgi:hypothetical protein
MFENLKAKIKGCIRSWTIWFNGVLGTFYAAMPFAKDSFPDLQPYLPSGVYMHILGAIVLVNILLRFKTTHPLEAK